MDYTQEIIEMQRLVNNIQLHLTYNHPTEAIKSLQQLKQDADVLEGQIKTA
jgi:hypothetical protein